MDEGNSKYGAGKRGILGNISKRKKIQLGEVVSVDDPQGLGRIKVRIKGSVNKGGDDNTLDADLPWAFPMLPKFYSAKPKIKEAVLIFVFSTQQAHADRLYLGPIISQPQLLKSDPYYNSALAGFTFGSQSPNVSYKTIPEVKGVFPNEEDVSIQGRDNTDVILKNNEILIRAGKFVTSVPSKTNPFSFKFNAATQGYIQIKNDTVVKRGDDNNPDEKGTIANIVASKINLITHKNGSPIFNVTNQDNLISDDEMLRILEEAHPLPFGDVLLQYLRLLKDAFINHVHNGNGNKPTDLTASGNKQSLDTFKKNAEDLENQMNSKNIRIN